MGRSGAFILSSIAGLSSLLLALNVGSVSSTIRHAEASVARDEWRVRSGGVMRPVDVDVLEDGTAWAVGVGIAHYDGAVWRRHLTLGGGVLRAIQMSGPESGWAVGEQGLLMSYSNGRWQSEEWSSVADWYALSAVAVDDIWAVGEGIAHYDGQEWTEVLPLGGDRLVAVSMLDANNGWAVGTRIMRYVEGEWRRLSKPVSELLLGVHARAVDDVWAVGRNGVVLHFDGNEWVKRSIGTELDVYDVYAIDEESAWLLSTNEVRLWDNGVSTRVLSLPRFGAQPTADCSNLGVPPHAEDGCLTSVDFADGSEGWAVGPDGVFVEVDSAARSADVAQWRLRLTEISIADHTDFGYAIGFQADYTDRGEGWVVTTSSRILRVSWVGEVIAGTSLDRTSLADLDVGADGVGWIVGNDGRGSRLYRVDETLNVVSVPVPAFQANGVAVVGAEEAWIVGFRTDGGRPCAFHYHQEELTCEPIPEGRYTAVDIANGSQGWAVGASGVIARYDNGEWVAYDSPVDEDLLSISISSYGVGWCGGQDGILLSTVDGEWEEEEQWGRAGSVLDLAARDALCVWGLRGSFLEEPFCDGPQVQLLCEGQLQPVGYTSCSDKLWALDAVDGGVLAVGSRQLIVHRSADGEDGQWLAHLPMVRR